MYRNAVKYGVYGWLAPGSDAYEMYKNQKWSELNRHVERLEKEKLLLEGATQEEADAHVAALHSARFDAKFNKYLELIRSYPPEVSDAPVEVGTICYDDSEISQREKDEK